MGVLKINNGNFCTNDNQWSDFPIAANSININPVIVKPDYGSICADAFGYCFDPAETETVYFSIQMPHSWNMETNIRPAIHWMPQTASVGSVLFGFTYRLGNVDGSFSAATTITSLATATANDNKHLLTTFSLVSMAGYTLSTIMLCSLSRYGNGSGDDYPSDIGLLNFDLYYKQDCVGTCSLTCKGW